MDDEENVNVEIEPTIDYKRIAAIACFVIAGVLCFASKDGWGWFLFFGLVLI